MTAHHLETLQCGHTQSRQKLFLCTGQPLPSGIHWDIFAHLSPMAFHRHIHSKHKSKRDTEGKEHKLLLYSNSSAVCCSNCHSSTSFCCWVFGVVFFCVAAESISFIMHCFSPTFTVWYLSTCNFSFIFLAKQWKDSDLLSGRLHYLLVPLRLQPAASFNTLHLILQPKSFLRCEQKGKFPCGTKEEDELCMCYFFFFFFPYLRSATSMHWLCLR